MRIVTISTLAMGFLLQFGCVSTLSPTATPSRLQAYHDQIAAQYVAANDLETQGDFEAARKLYLELHEKHPKNADYLHRLAVVNTRLQRYSEANSYYCRAHAIDPTNPRLLADMGYTYYLTGDMPEAEAILRESLRVKPNDPRATNNLALVVGSLGKMEECLTLLNEVNSKAESLGCLAYIHAQRGELDLAEERYAEALALNPNLKNASKALAELQKRHPSRNVVVQMLPESIETESKPPKTTPPVRSRIQQVSATLPLDAEVDASPSQVVTADFQEDAAGFGQPALHDARFESAESAFSNSSEAKLLPTDSSDETSETHLPATSDDETDWAN